MTIKALRLMRHYYASRPSKRLGNTPCVVILILSGLLMIPGCTAYYNIIRRCRVTNRVQVSSSETGIVGFDDRLRSPLVGSAEADTVCTGASDLISLT